MQLGLTRLGLDRPFVPIFRSFPNLRESAKGVRAQLLAYGARISPAIYLETRARRACVYDDPEAT